MRYLGTDKKVKKTETRVNSLKHCEMSLSINYWIVSAKELLFSRDCFILMAKCFFVTTLLKFIHKNEKSRLTCYLRLL